MGKLKPKTKAFVDKLIENPTMSQTEAYIQTHETTNRNSARSTAAQLLAMPSVQIYRQNQVDAAKQTIVKLSQHGENDSIKLKASQDILDRTEGKATLKTISESHNLNINIEANEEIANNFMKFMKQETAQR